MHAASRKPANCAGKIPIEVIVPLFVCCFRFIRLDKGMCAGCEGGQTMLMSSIHDHFAQTVQLGLAAANVVTGLVPTSIWERRNSGLT